MKYENLTGQQKKQVANLIRKRRNKTLKAADFKKPNAKAQFKAGNIAAAISMEGFNINFTDMAKVKKEFKLPVLKKVKPSKKTLIKKVIITPTCKVNNDKIILGKHGTICRFTANPDGSITIKNL